MEKSSQKRPQNNFQIIDLGIMQLNWQKTLLHRLIVEFTHYLPKKKKNNMNFSLKIYTYKGFAAPNLPMQADSSLFERKMASFIWFKTIKIWTNGQSPINTPCCWSQNSSMTLQKNVSSQSSTFGGDTTIFALKKATNTKPPSKLAKDFLNQWSCSLD